MQYVRNISNTAWTTWNSLNPATLSGAIDVIVVEQEDGSLVCSPFHVRFGKFSLLRPYEKKVEFKVNGAKQDYAMKLGEGGEAFFIFETTAKIPKNMQTSPLVSPASSPPLDPQRPSSSPMQEPEPLELEDTQIMRISKPRSSTVSRPSISGPYQSGPAGPASQSDEILSPIPNPSEPQNGRPKSGDWSATFRAKSETPVPHLPELGGDDLAEIPPDVLGRSHSPPPLAPKAAIERATALCRELEAVNIPSHVTETGDLKLDMTGFKSSDEDALRAELLARKILSEELDGNYDIGALFGVDEEGNLWIYSSEEAKDAAMKSMANAASEAMANDAASDPGYQSDSSDATNATPNPLHRRSESDVGLDSEMPPTSPEAPKKSSKDSPSFAKTLRLTSEQLKALELKEGENTMSFTVNRSTCQAKMYLWKHSTPVVISDIDGTITKSDAMGHVMNMIGRDWTHTGVAKLYSDIIANGYNIMYLTSRSVGQSDTTRAYLYGIQQGGIKLPRGPTILSPDRTMAALRREIYLRKPHVFKMSTLRDIRSLYGKDGSPFYAGFGNRLTDQISYRTVDVPSHRIFTINSNAEVSLDLLSLNQLKLSYVNMTDIVDHYFPPVSSLITTKGGGDDYTDFKYWRDDVLDIDDFSASESDENVGTGRKVASSLLALDADDEESVYDDEEEEDEDEDENEDMDAMAGSYLSRNSEDEEGGYYPEGQDSMMSESMMDDEYAGDEEELEDDLSGAEEEVTNGRIRRPVRRIEGEDVMEEEEEANEKDDMATADDGSGLVGNVVSPVAVEDVDAEIITGVKNLSFTREVKDVDGRVQDQKKT